MTPKQRREQDILIRKAKEITKRVKNFKGSPSEREREIIESQIPGSSVSEGTVNLPDGQSFLLEGAQGVAGSMSGMKKGGKVKMHKMPGGKMMKNSDMKKKKKMGGGMMSDESFQYSKGGMVRGQGIAIRGTKFKGIF